MSKVVELENEAKLVRAGADQTVSPYRIGGLRMVSELVRPKVNTPTATQPSAERARHEPAMALLSHAGLTEENRPAGERELAQLNQILAPHIIAIRQASTFGAT